jgi:hypothetical protein
VQTKASATLFPVITFEVHDNASIEDLEKMFGIFDQAEGRSGMHVTITDASAVRAMPDAKTRRFVAEKQAVADVKFGPRSLGAVIVVDSAIVRGALTAINWIKPVKARQQYVATRLDGMRVCVQWLEAARIAIPNNVRAYLRELERDPRAPFP